MILQVPPSHAQPPAWQTCPQERDPFPDHLPKGWLKSATSKAHLPWDPRSWKGDAEDRVAAALIHLGRRTGTGWVFPGGCWLRLLGGGKERLQGAPPPRETALKGPGDTPSPQAPVRMAQDWWPLCALSQKAGFSRDQPARDLSGGLGTSRWLFRTLQGWLCPGKPRPEPHSLEPSPLLPAPRGRWAGRRQAPPLGW